MALEAQLNPSRSPSPEPLTHVQEQQALRKETISAFHTAVDGSGDADNDDLLVLREKTKDEQEREEEEYRAYLEREVGDLKDIIGEADTGVQVEEGQEEEGEKEKKKKKKKKKGGDDKQEEDSTPTTKKTRKSKEEEDQEFLLKYVFLPLPHPKPDSIPPSLVTSSTAGGSTNPKTAYQPTTKSPPNPKSPNPNPKTSLNLIPSPQVLNHTATTRTTTKIMTPTPPSNPS